MWTPVAVIRCSRCGKAFERTAHQVQVCPNCGLRAPLVDAAAEPLIPQDVRGRPRRALVVLLLTFLLHVVFWPLYLLQTFRPLDKQHGRFHPMAWWGWSCIPLLGAFLGIPYAWIGLVRLQRSRRARGLRRGLGPFWFTLVAVLGPLAAIGFVAWKVGTANLTDGALWGKTLSDWTVALEALAIFSFTPAVALALATSSANALWRAIYAERGESWPWRGGPGETDIPVSP